MKVYAYFDDQEEWEGWHDFIRGEKGYPLQPVFRDGQPNPSAVPITQYSEGLPSPTDESYCALVFASDWTGPTLTFEEAEAYFPQAPPPQPPE